MMDSLILRTATRLLLSLMLLFSFFILLRGHNEPGGGFIGGLVAASAFALHSIAFGPRALRRPAGVRSPVDRRGRHAVRHRRRAVVRRWGRCLPKAEWLHWGQGDGGLPCRDSPLVFDIGVFLVVIGAVLTIVLALEEEDV